MALQNLCDPPGRHQFSQCHFGAELVPSKHAILTMETKTPNELAMEALNACLTDLHGIAVGIVDDHWAQVIEADKKAQTWEDKSRLQVSCYRLGNHIQLKWVGTKWYGGKGARKPVKINVPRAAGNLTYSMTKLKEWARPWEIEIVEATEDKLAAIRKQAFHIVRAIMSLRNADRIAKKQPIEEDHPDSDGDADSN